MSDEQKEKPELEEPTAPFWMTTYGDMVTLLMVFFILILSFSTIQLEKFKGAMSSMKGALGVLPENISTYKKQQDPNYEDFESKKRQELIDTMNDVEEILEKMGLAEMVDLEFTGEGVMVRMGDDLLFDSGKARIKNQATPVMDIVVQAFKGKFKDIYVEGHTDNIPIKSLKYPSNWELSAARSMSVIKYLNKKGKIPPTKLTAVGHGEHRPLVDNNTRGNRAKNRRVEMFFKM
ncbi:MAG: flagellar motor protein MotB [Calditrichaeota bacterium]|nr:MAG: flagellar motor protein MotB [Calditrichota bacterium]MBL1204013.1 flagellar motor protein MotB [Calditrichota bacterium]NOG43844.1 OmpA family protein [Calditrichota bacterium]